MGIFESPVWPVIFFFSIILIIYLKIEDRKRPIKSQFFISMSLIILIFYLVSIISGVCTIFNFIFRYLI